MVGGTQVKVVPCCWGVTETAAAICTFPSADLHLPDRIFATEDRVPELDARRADSDIPTLARKRTWRPQ